VDRRRFLLTSLAGVLAGPLAAVAQPHAKARRIGVLGNSPSPHLDAEFRQGLHDLGWFEGRNISLLYRYSEGRNERLADLAAELVALNVDVIVAWAAPEAGAAKQATKAIPIVFLVHGDPVANGHVSSLAKPGGNMTGSTQMHPETSSKQLDLLKQAFPSISRVSVLWNAGNPAKLPDWNEASKTARALQLTLQSREVRRPNDFDSAFISMRRDRPDAMMTLNDPLTYHYRQLIVRFANEERLPAMYALREFVDTGGLMAYGVDLRYLFRRGAIYVDKILKGASPAEIPIEQPTKFELVINLKTAKALGLTIPPSLLARADQIIE